MRRRYIHGTLGRTLHRPQPVRVSGAHIKLNVQHCSPSRFRTMQSAGASNVTEHPVLLAAPHQYFLDVSMGKMCSSGKPAPRASQAPLSRAPVEDTCYGRDQIHLFYSNGRSPGVARVQDSVCRLSRQGGVTTGPTPHWRRKVLELWFRVAIGRSADTQTRRSLDQ